LEKVKTVCPPTILKQSFPSWIQMAVLDGRQPVDLTVQMLRGLPLNWAEQRKRLGVGRSQ